MLNCPSETVGSTIFFSPSKCIYPYCIHSSKLLSDPSSVEQNKNSSRANFAIEWKKKNSIRIVEIERLFVFVYHFKKIYFTQNKQIKKSFNDKIKQFDMIFYVTEKLSYAKNTECTWEWNGENDFGFAL